MTLFLLFQTEPYPSLTCAELDRTSTGLYQTRLKLDFPRPYGTVRVWIKFK